MNQIIIKQFQSEKEKMREEIKIIYEQIEDEVSKLPINEIVRTMTVKESKFLNDYCVTVRNRIEVLSKKILIENGVSNNAAEILWSKVRLAVRTPKIELCKEIPIETEPLKVPHTPEKQKTHYGAVITISGAALEVIGWLFVPSLKTVAAITKTLGIVLVIAGTYIMLKENSETKPRITLNETARAARARKVTETISEKQIGLNTNIISEWIDCVADVLYQEYRKEMEGRR